MPSTFGDFVRATKHVLLCGTGFLADAYDLFVINVVKDIMAKIYPQSAADSSMIASVALAGAVVGQIFFGLTADYFGRKKLFIATVVLVLVGVLGSALSFAVSGFSIYYALGFWRFVLGVGVGGEYPLSATVTKETTDVERSGRKMAIVFSMQGLGACMSAIVVAILLNSGAELETCWRVALAFGGVPGLIGFYFRWKMEEPEHQRASQGPGLRSFLKGFGAVMKANARNVVSTSIAWFLLDIVFYANGLFSNSMLLAMGLGTDLRSAASATVVVTAMALPGYYVTVFTIDRIGRKRLQVLGFLVLGVLYLVMGLAFTELQRNPAGFIILYGLTFFFSNWGANATTYIIPGELFPSEVRASCHGLSAAAGKLGAVVGGAMLAPLKQAKGVPGVLLVCAIVSAVGGVFSLIFTPNYHPRDLPHNVAWLNDGAEMTPQGSHSDGESEHKVDGRWWHDKQGKPSPSNAKVADVSDESVEEAIAATSASTGGEKQVAASPIVLGTVATGGGKRVAPPITVLGKEGSHSDLRIDAVPRSPRRGGSADLPRTAPGASPLRKEQGTSSAGPA